MNYNQFTIEYIKAVKANLKIEFGTDGNAIFIPESITENDILSLKNELQKIWIHSESAIEVVKTKRDATIQSGLFGIVNEFDIAVKVGFLMGDRVVLIDYLFERILLKKEPKKIDLTRLGWIAVSLVNLLPLAERGRIVIIPNPFSWNSESKKIIEEVAEKANLSVELMSLLNMLSVTKICQLHPYTIAESNEAYESILNSQIDTVDVIGRDGAKYAYDGILGALLSEKLLTETELKVALRIPISQYFEIINANKSFYTNYLSEITAGGSLSGQSNIENLRNRLLQSISEQNKVTYQSTVKAATMVGGISSGAIGLLSAVTVISAPLIIIGAALAFSSTLTGLINTDRKTEQPIISVFKNLYNA